MVATKSHRAIKGKNRRTVFICIIFKNDSKFPYMMEERKPLIGYILRDKYTSSVHAILDAAKAQLNHNGYDVIAGTSLDDIPDEKIADLDLLIAHVTTDDENGLEEQMKLKKFRDAGIRVVNRLGLKEELAYEKWPAFGKIEDNYFMKPGADIVKAVEYFLNNGKVELPSLAIKPFSR